MDKGCTIIAKSGGYCGDMELEYAPKGTCAKLTTITARLKEAEGLLHYVISPAFYSKSRIKRDEPIMAFLSTPSNSNKILVRREDLPDPDKLLTLADWFDLIMKFPHDPDKEVQTTLRRWANNIKTALENK
jgi:hypothetical protein